MIKVLMCGNHPSNRGGMTTIINQIRSYDWINSGIELSFIPTYKPGNKLITIAYFIFAYIKILLTFIFEKPDIVHMHMSYKGSFLRKASIHKLCKLFGVKDIIHLHGSEFKKWYDTSPTRQKERIYQLIKSCDAFIVLGQQWEKVIVNICPLAKILVLSNAVNIPNETVEWDTEGKVNFLFMGVLIKRKGVLDLLKAISIIKSNSKRIKMHFNIAGDGSESEEIKIYAEREGLEDEISFLGWLSGEDKINAYRQNQVFILPSYNEGLPVAILEAMSYGMPIIASNVGDISSAVINEINGYLIMPGDINNLAKCILQFSDSSKFQEMSEMSKIIIKEKYSDSQFYSKLKMIYDKLEL